MVDPVMVSSTNKPIFFIDLSGQNSIPERAITEAEFSSETSYFLAHVTPSNLSRNHMGLSNKFAKPNGLYNRQCEIDLLNEEGKAWTLELKHNKTAGQTYMCRGWTSFCKENGIGAGSSCRFKFVQTGIKPVLQLCLSTSTILPQGNSSKALDVPETENCSETAQMNQNRAMNLTKRFTIANGLHKSWCEIDLMNQTGKSWVVHLRYNKRTGQEFLRGGWRSFCHDNELKTGCFYRFELVLTGTRPALQLCSDNTPQGNCAKANSNGKAKVSAKPSREGDRSRKKARVPQENPLATLRHHKNLL
ncbi:unnamed protein product [Eruca vesicaria subsp. sativa]|uniref:TF-B3 domain-containing protein n=1 Tax=Eruca vesicaria subsp. sativa TaxID=29727 RepID=A0ABC8JJA9_ERUVS|nr:unnamed protein product [Eruca vesicaria subsp. sativa]